MRYSHTRYQHRAQDKKFLTFHRQFFQFRAPRPIFRLPTFVKLLFSRKSISGRKLELVSLQTTLCAPPGLCEILLDTSTGATTELNEWPRLWCRSFHHAIPFDYIFFFLTAYLNFHNIIYQLARRRRETQSVFPISISRRLLIQLMLTRWRATYDWTCPSIITKSFGTRFFDRLTNRNCRKIDNRLIQKLFHSRHELTRHEPLMPLMPYRTATFFYQ